MLTVHSLTALRSYWYDYVPWSKINGYDTAAVQPGDSFNCSSIAPLAGNTCRKSIADLDMLARPDSLLTLTRSEALSNAAGPDLSQAALRKLLCSQGAPGGAGSAAVGAGSKGAVMPGD